VNRPIDLQPREIAATRPATSNFAEAAILEASPADAVQTASPQRITLRIDHPGAPPLDVHIAGRGDRIHIEVRTQDLGMQGALREDLSSLVRSLDHAGYQAEAVTPLEFLARQTGMAGAVAEAPGTSAGHTMRDPRGGENASDDRRHRGDGGPPQQQSRDQPQQERQRRNPADAWLETLETIA
jgi:hypothetical protein